MNPRRARKYAREVFVRAVDVLLEDDEWISRRFAPEELRAVLREVSSLRTRLLVSSLPLPEQRGEESDVSRVPSAPAPHTHRAADFDSNER